jgi:hypothetical protein
LASRALGSPPSSTPCDEPPSVTEARSHLLNPAHVSLSLHCLISLWSLHLASPALHHLSLVLPIIHS